MDILMSVGIVILLFIIVDYFCFWRQIERFEQKARDFSDMYNYITPRVLHGNPDAPEIKEFVYEGTMYCTKVKKGDLKNLYAELSSCIADVIETYEEISDRYIFLMDDETAKRISEQIDEIQDIAGIVRYQSWLNK